MSVITPIDQRYVALERANEVRFAIANVKRSLAAGEISLLEALEHPALENMWLSKILQCQRYTGPTKALALCNRVGVSPARRCGQLTVRQRMQLAEWA